MDSHKLKTHHEIDDFGQLGTGKKHIGLEEVSPLEIREREIELEEA